MRRAAVLALICLAAAPAGWAQTRPLPAERPPLAESPPPEARGPTAAPPEARVPEPEGYHGEPYKSPVPATLKGAEVIDDTTAHALWWSGRVPFVDVLPTPVRPPDLPEGTLWRDPPRESIPGATWLANTGYQGLDDVTLGYFLAGLALVTGGDKDAPFVVFCKRDCWMSWNAGKRALENGYTRVFWYPAGSEGWADNGWALERVEPFKP